jgi:uncharacterized membrane protein
MLDSTSRGPAAAARSRAVGALVAGHLCITLPLSVLLNIWVDEAYSLHTTAHGIGEAWRRALSFEMQPPFYFVLLSLWRFLSPSLFHARLLSVCCAAATLPLVAGLSRRYLPEASPSWLVAAVAFHPFFIWAALETRPYALAILLSSALLWLFFDGYLAATSTGLGRRLHGVVAFVALLTQYYLGFLLLSAAVALVVQKRWRSLATYVAHMLAVGLAFAPMLLIIPAQVANHSGTVTVRVPVLYGARLIAWRVAAFVWPASWAPVPVQWALFWGLAAVIGVALLVRPRSGAWTAVAVIAVVQSALFWMALRATAEELAQPRHLAALFLPVLIALLGLLRSAHGNRALWAWALIAGISYTAALAVRYRPLAKDGDFSRVAAFIMANEKAGQPIVVFGSEAALPLSFYYRGPNRIVPLPRPASLEVFDPRLFALGTEAQIEEELGGDVTRSGALWLVLAMQPPCRFLDVDYHCDTLDAFVSRRYSTERTEAFYKTTVKLLERRPEGAGAP